MGDFLFLFDLKSAYHHIMINEGYKKYLGFKWKEKYVFNVLPFGLSTAGYIFTNVLREAVKFWRSKGYKVVMYLDDGIGGSQTFESAEILSSEIQADLNALGFILADDKCQWKPTQEIVWLGLVWNTEINKLSVSNPRIQKLKGNIQNILEGYTAGFKWFEVSSIASVVGPIISTQTVFGDMVKLRTGYLYYCILVRSGWNFYIMMSQEAVDELQFWVNNLET